MNPEKLLEAIMALLQAKSEAKAMQSLRDHPELLRDEPTLCQQFISNANQRGDVQAEKILGQRRDFYAP